MRTVNRYIALFPIPRDSSRTLSGLIGPPWKGDELSARFCGQVRGMEDKATVFNNRFNIINHSMCKYKNHVNY